MQHLNEESSIACRNMIGEGEIEQWQNLAAGEDLVRANGSLLAPPELTSSSFMVAFLSLSPSLAHFSLSLSLFFFYGYRLISLLILC